MSFITILTILMILPFIFFLRKDILRHPELGIPALAYLIPFERLGAIKTVVDIRLSQILVSLLILIYLINLIRTYLKGKKFPAFKKDLSLLLLLVFAAVALISITQTTDKIRSIEVFGFDLFIFIVFIFLTQIISSKAVLMRTVWALLATSFVTATFGLFQFITGMFNLSSDITGLAVQYAKGYSSQFPNIVRIQATGLEPEYWGNFLLIPLGLSLAILLRQLSLPKQEQNKKLLVFVIILTFIVLANILLTFSRGTWYASIVLFIIINSFYWKKLFNLKVISWYVAFTCWLVVVFFGSNVIVQKTLPASNLAQPKTISIQPTKVTEEEKAPIITTTIITTPVANNQKLATRATDIVDTGRAASVHVALDFFKQHPLLGIGIGDYGPRLNPDIKASFTKNTQYGIVNNEYVEILAETGLLGAISIGIFFLFFIYKAIRNASKVTPPIQLFYFAFIGIIGGILVQYLAFSNLWFFQVWFVFGVINAIRVNTEQDLFTE